MTDIIAEAPVVLPGVISGKTSFVSGTGGGASALSDLTDVNVANAAEGQVLTYQNGQWIPADAGGAGFQGTRWFAGAGLPVTAQLPGARIGDYYINTLTGDVFNLT